ncbi:hypothetical protein SELR_pSRC400040 (plasmid) [Selenomonas ruminantium subsp. lactilytica TAM6421]|uniref:Uncharacterized protein n=1 Tax=Selenomonas ruminantium subsp. lactilytica (strain NBRC 103574 / TAM6421) TaxID=927704 RepID=I0GV68_SELRL|nr:hypothetical protein [Selenomonas ruminantium]BAL84655.1 hypothetical protein SELR_pSRC400040 [Selenomonas ruminantium subsp. lactilytica TAM6421]
MSIGKEIYKQLGGNQFAYITGAKHFLTHDNWLSFRIGRNGSKANYVKITLTPMDTYTVEFKRITTPRLSRKTWTYSEYKETLIAKREGVYCDQLQEVFTEVTGLVTRMPRVYFKGGAL